MLPSGLLVRIYQRKFSTSMILLVCWFTWAKRRFTTECTEMPSRLVSVNSVTSVVSPFPVTLTNSPAGG
jgi:hypothetical protein